MIRKVMKNIINIINNVSIMKKLYFSLLIFIAIPLLIFGYTIYNKFSAGLTNQFEFSSRQAFEQTALYMEYKIFNISGIADILLMDNKVQELLAYTPSGKYDDMIIQDDYYRRMLDFLYSLERNKDFFRISLYIRDGLMFSNERDHFFNMTSLEGNGIIGNMENDNKKLYWFPDGVLDPGYNGQKNLISVLCRIKDLDDYHVTLGVCRIDLLEGDIIDIIKRSKITPLSSVAVINEKMQTITSVSSHDSLDFDLYKKEITDILNKSKGTLLQDKIEIGKQKGILLSRSISGTDWTILLFIPDKDILLNTIWIRNQTLIFIIILCIFAYIFIFFISNTITSRINKLVIQMKQTESGDFSKVFISQGNNDEIGQLSKNFNHMLVKISNLIDEQYNLGKVVKNAELKALQAQINPHFLYNTLELIRWMAKDNKTDQISRILYSLAKFYKLSLSKGEDIIPFRDEIEHIKTYVEIQNMRFDNCINLVVDINEELLELSIVKLVLQPIIENSILHGILEKDDETGNIIVTAEVVEKDLVITITDDGVGIENKDLENISNGDLKERKSGYGIYNINERIKLYYGNEYGLKYDSIFGEGTTVQVRIPAMWYNK